ncbi:MAG: hypothetical protein AAF208_13260 [Cyanobacteria bacterium P01_A01_bin.45]
MFNKSVRSLANRVKLILENANIKNIVSFLTFASLTTGLILAIIWYLRQPLDFEPAVTAIGLLATITGIFAERWASVRQEQKVLLLSLCREFQSNATILSDTRFKQDIQSIQHPVVYPRLIMSVTQTAIASGAFAESQYKDLFSLLHKWHDIVNEFNRRLDITELRTFVNPSPPEIREFYQALRGSNNFNDAITVLGDICNLLKTKHLNERKYIKEIEMTQQQLYLVKQITTDL